MINHRIFLTFYLFIDVLFFFIPSFAQELSVVEEKKGAHRCCAPHGISYCDLSAGHYVCNDGGYSACMCTQSAPTATYAELMLGCCLWHGGIAANNMGMVVCQDGSLSQVCSIQSLNATTHDITIG